MRLVEIASGVRVDTEEVSGLNPDASQVGLGQTQGRKKWGHQLLYCRPEGQDREPGYRTGIISLIRLLVCHGLRF